MELMKKIERLRQTAIKMAKTPEGGCRLERVHFAFGYAEPGYADPASGIIAFGNWNDVTKWNKKTNEFDHLDSIMSKFAEHLEKSGVEIEWEDEWGFCPECGKAFRTSSDSYGWEPCFIRTDDDLICPECLNEEAILKAYIGQAELLCLNSPHPEDYGFIKLMECVKGLYGGQSSDPEKIFNALKKRGVSRFIFRSEGRGQFELRFSVWVDEREKSKCVNFSYSETHGADPAEMCKKALASVPIRVAAPGKIVYNKINLTDGSVETREIGPEEFAEGIK